MKTIVLAAAALVAMAVAAPAFADSSVSAGYTAINDSGYNLGLINLRYGWQSRWVDFESPNQREGMFGVEVEAGVSAKSDSGVKVSSEFGLFGKALYEATDHVGLFARVGYAQATIKAGPTSNTESGLAYGAGVQWFLDKDANNGLRFEYTNYDLGGSTGAYGVSYIRRFD